MNPDGEIVMKASRSTVETELSEVELCAYSVARVAQSGYENMCRKGMSFVLEPT
jgi:hypothetical protein